MRKFSYKDLEQKKWENEIVAYIAAIHEHKAKQELFLKQKPEALERLVEVAKIQSTEASNEIEGIRTSDTRLRQLLKEKTAPKNRDEEEIAGYREVLNLIHENYEYIKIDKNHILQLHKVLYQYSPKNIGGSFKNVQNFINAQNEKGEVYTLFTPLEPFETPQAIEDICNEFNQTLASGNVEPLILIPIFIHDFLCIHPFLDGNGRMSRLLTTLLLYKSGFLVGKYISLESKIAKTKNRYYDTLETAQQGWHEGKENVEEFIKYILGIVLAAYRDFEERADTISSKATNYEIVKKAVFSVVGKFTKRDIAELCPSLSEKTIERVLKQLVEEKVISRQGSGRKTFYNV